MNTIHKQGFCIVAADNMAALDTTLTEHGKTFQILEGCYHDKRERSFIFMLEDSEINSLPALLVKMYNQDSVLVSRNDRTCYLLYQNGDKLEIGTMTGVSKETALKQDGYSYNPMTDTYYICQ